MCPTFGSPYLFDKASTVDILEAVGICHLVIEMEDINPSLFSLSTFIRLDNIKIRLDLRSEVAVDCFKRS